MKGGRSFDKYARPSVCAQKPMCCSSTRDLFSEKMGDTYPSTLRHFVFILFGSLCSVTAMVLKQSVATPCGVV